MKHKLFYVLMLSITPLVCLGQYWAPIGATWHYELEEYIPPIYNDLIILQSIGDTIVNGDSAINIQETIIHIIPYTEDTSISVGSFITKFDSNRVYYFYPLVNDYRLLYDFNADVGDTFRVICPQSEIDSSITVVVDSVSYKIINADTLKVQHIRQPNPELCYMYGFIIERIGWPEGMFPIHTWFDNRVLGKLRCYEDPIIGLYQHNTSIPCDYITTSYGKIENSKNGVNIYPNPTTGTIEIQASIGIEKIQLQSHLGKIIREYRNESIINLNDLTNGIYFLVFFKNGESLINKIIKTGH